MKREMHRQKNRPSQHHSSSTPSQKPSDRLSCSLDYRHSLSSGNDGISFANAGFVTAQSAAFAHNESPEHMLATKASLLDPVIEEPGIMEGNESPPRFPSNSNPHSASFQPQPAENGVPAQHPNSQPPEHSKADHFGAVNPMPESD